MKKRYISIIVALLSCVYGAMAQGVDNAPAVVFLHGMNGSASSLMFHYYRINNYQKIHLINRATKIYSPIEYRSVMGVETSASDVENVIYGFDRNFYNRPKRIIIAHSMGGLVARKWQVNKKFSSNKQAYTGLITLATPHSGTAIASLLNSEQGARTFQSNMESATKSILEGAIKNPVNAISTIVNAKIWVAIRATTALLPGLERLIGKTFERGIEAAFNYINLYENYIVPKVTGSHRVLRDLAYNSDIIKTIQTHDKNACSFQYDTLTYKIALYGDEIAPSVFRMISASFWIDKNKHRYDVMPHDKIDEDLIHLFNELSAFFRVNAEQNLQSIKWYMLPKKRDDYKEKSAAWTRSADYLNYSFHSVWQNLLGLITVKYETKTVTSIIGGSKTYSIPRITELPNDGLVIKESQIAMQGAYEKKLVEINHEEMKVHDDAGNALERILYGRDEGLSRNPQLSKHKEFFQLYGKK